MPLTQIDPAWWRRSVALVAQEPVLFACSVRDNIGYGATTAPSSDEVQARPLSGPHPHPHHHPRPHAHPHPRPHPHSHPQPQPLNPEQVQRAAATANAHDFVSGFPEQYDTLVGERGVQLSGGQKQRIAIARALLMDPKVLLLDEATSALDAESEHVVQEAIDRLMSRRTTILVAHRLSTVRGADCICAVHKGRIVERGTHDELIAQQGMYYKLNRRQLQGGLRPQDATSFEEALDAAEGA